MKKLSMLTLLLSMSLPHFAFADHHETGKKCDCSKECKENCEKGKSENCKCEKCDCKTEKKCH